MPLFRKLLGSQDGTPKGGVTKASPPAGMLTMGAQLQRKFAKGIQYNMKIVIRGDRMVGKTCLFYRLQGQKFHEEYIPTEEIQVCSIQWNYKTTDDVVKVEVWDIVDKGKKKKTEGLKLSTDQDIEEPTLDAEFLDVYKGTHGVIFMYDITKQWTFSYVEREIEKVPSHIPILVLGNHRDMGDHRTVMEDKARYFCRHLDRPEDSPQVRYAESSMKNGFGLKYLHKFFNIPFLKLQRETLLKQLEINGDDLQSTMEELDIHEESEEQNYTMFLDALINKKQQQQEDSRRKSVEQEAKKTAEKPANLPVPKSVSMPAIPKTGVQPREAASVGNTPIGRGQPIPTTQTPTSGDTDTTPQQPEQKSGFFSRFFKSKEQNTPKQEPEVVVQEDTGDHSAVRSVEDFIPDGGVIDKSFLDDTKEVKDVAKVTRTTDSDSDEESTGNPMVARFQDDLDSDEDFKDSGPAAVTQDVELSSDDEEEHVAMTTKDVDISDDEDLNSPSVHVVTADDDLSSDENETTIKITQKTEKMQKGKRSKSNSSDVSSHSKDDRKNSIQARSSSESFTEDKETSSDAKSKNVENEKPISANLTEKKRCDSITDQPAQTVNCSDNSDIEEATNQIEVAKDIDVEEDDIKQTHHEGFDNWLDDMESKAGLKVDSSLSDSEPEVLPVPSKKKSTSKSSKVAKVNEDIPTSDKQETKKKKKKKKDNDATSEEKKSKKKDKQKTKKEKDGVKKEKKKKEKALVNEERDSDQERNALEAFLNDGGGYDSL